MGELLKGNGMNTNELDVKLAELKQLAITTFGSEETANSWLNKKLMLYGDTPIAIAKTEEGYEQMMKVLNAIMYGGVV